MVTYPTPRQIWNKGLLVGPKPPLKPRHIWAIRTRLQAQGATSGETTPIAVGNTPASTRFAIFDGDLWTPEDVLTACGLQRIPLNT